MEFPPTTPPAFEAWAEEQAARADVANHMHDAIHRTVAFAERYAQHTADLAVVPYNAQNRDAIAVLMHAIYTEAHRLATDEFNGIPLSLRLVVPLWLETAAGSAFPPLGVITVPHVPPVTAPTVNVLALASRDREPSLWLTDWAWVGIYPITTPYYVPGATTCEPRPCDGACDTEASA
jgi:hypothetical protein